MKIKCIIFRSKGGYQYSIETEYVHFKNIDFLTKKTLCSPYNRIGDNDNKYELTTPWQIKDSGIRCATNNFVFADEHSACKDMVLTLSQIAGKDVVIESFKLKKVKEGFLTYETEVEI